MIFQHPGDQRRPDSPDPRHAPRERPDIIVLAAGSSTRFGANKLLQRFGERTVLERVLAAASPVANRIILVTGFDAERVRAVAERSFDVDPAYNACYDLGMFSSIQRGVREVGADRFAVVPGDLPLLRREDFEAVLAGGATAGGTAAGGATARGATARGAIARGEAPEVPPVVRPRYRGTPGHPVLMSARLIPRISAMPASGSMPEVHAHYDVTYIEVDTPAVCADIDTVAEYESIRRGELPG